MGVCLHCGSEVAADSAGGAEFCCRGCRGAYALLRNLGLDAYYSRRSLDPTMRPLRPGEDEAELDYSSYESVAADGVKTLYLMVEGLQCAACVWLIESVLARQPGVVQARLNMTTRRLVLKWRESENDANALVAPVMAIGYRLMPYDPDQLGSESERHERELLRAMAVAGFAAANVMLFSVSIWAGEGGDMGWTTLSLFHWLSALIALPAIVYCIRPFARSAIRALSVGRTNMDVPITIGVVLTSAMSLWETILGGPHAYFDASISLLFFLLVGRYLDARARGRARSAAEHLLSLGAKAVTVVDDGGRRLLPPSQLTVGMTILTAAGERIGADGMVVEGISDVDLSLITGETAPVAAEPGRRVFAGTMNLSAPLFVRVEKVGDETLLSEIVRMMEVAEQGRARYVSIADRVSRYYAPVVHLAALCTFLGWVLFMDAPWQAALLTAVSVLIITCPCALALAVPVVQVVVSGRLLRQGILLKSPSAQERLARADTVVFDKTGTLTSGRLELVPDEGRAYSDLLLAAGIAAASKHPVARAILRAVPDAMVLDGVVEVPGCGLTWKNVKLGSRRWLGITDEAADSLGPELFLVCPDVDPVRFAFMDTPRPDAADVVAGLVGRGYDVALLSGDRAATVAKVSHQVGIKRWLADLDPGGKCQRLAELENLGRKVVMVGDGLNDAPALSAAYVSISPASAIDISQTAADVVFQGERLAPVLEALDVAKRADVLVRQNFAFAFLYNVITVPIAVMGLVTPLLAAIAMSSSSVLVIVNALRLARRRRG